MQSKNTQLDLRGLALVVVVGAWLAGILLESWFSLAAFALPAFVPLMGACAALLWLIPLWRDSQARLVMLVLLWLLLGAWRYAIALPDDDPQAISAYIGAGKIEVRGSVADEPKLEGKSRVLLIAVSGVSKDKGTSWQDAHGQLEVQTLGGEIENPYGPNYGDDVELQGKLQLPTPYTPPGVFASMAFPRVNVSSTGGNPILAALYHLRNRLASIIAQSLPQPEAGYLIAILLGLHTPALTPLVTDFNKTGTAHLVAASGFKVTLLAGLVVASTRWLYERPDRQQTRMLPAQKLKDWRRWLATALVIGSIAAYTVLNGAGPAALRAGIMGILLVIAPRLGRIYNIYTALAAAALLMSIFDPFILWDAGFQLSFLGTLGIVVLTPYFQRLFKPIERLPFGHYVAEINAVTLAAQIATLPITALTFNQVSLIAPIPNMLTVPLLGTLIFIGMLLCGMGVIFAPLGLLCGWIAWPLLWYVGKVVIWCAMLPDASLTVNTFTIELAWIYYALLALLTMFLLYRWPQKHQSHHRPLLSAQTWRLLQLSAGLLVILATGVTAWAIPPDGRLTITFLSVGPVNQPQGEAILVRTPDGKTALIDGGLDAASLAKELDSRLLPWQRSLDAVILTTPRTDDLVGLQDVVSRYQVGEVLDAGMLHPSTGYALWRRTVAERNIQYVQVRQGTTLALGTQVALQVFWPPSPLHKGTNEELENGLVVRLVAPGLRVLLLGATVLSKNVLNGLLSNVAASYLQADIVQVVAEVGKNIPGELSAVLQAAHPSLVIVTPAALSAKQRKAGATSVLNPLPSILVGGTWQTVQTAEVGTVEINSSNSGWGLNV